MLLVVVVAVVVSVAFVAVAVVAVVVVVVVVVGAAELVVDSLLLHIISFLISRVKSEQGRLS